MEAILLLIALGLPLAAGFVLARRHPALAAPLAALLAAIPLLAVFGGLVVHLSSTDQAAPFGLAAVLIFGTVALLCGFGLGMVGHAIGSRAARK